MCFSFISHSFYFFHDLVQFSTFPCKKQPLLESFLKLKPTTSCEFTTPEAEVLSHQMLWGCSRIAVCNQQILRHAVYPGTLPALWTSPNSFELLKSKQCQDALWSQHYIAQELKWVNSKQFSFDLPRYASRNLQLPLNSVFNLLYLFEFMQQPKYLGVVF